jgi:hypothetical protein
MANISDNANLRAHLRAELGLGSSSRVRDSDIEAEIQAAKDHLSKELAYKVDSGETLDFSGRDLEATLEYFLRLRLAPLSERRGGPPLKRIPAGHPRSMSEMKRTDFGNSEMNFWRDRMGKAFNRV